jgi:hypothetical protein
VPFGAYDLKDVYLFEKTPSPVSLGQNVHGEGRGEVLAVTYSGPLPVITMTASCGGT